MGGVLCLIRLSDSSGYYFPSWIILVGFAGPWTVSPTSRMFKSALGVK